MEFHKNYTKRSQDYQSYATVQYIAELVSAKMPSSAANDCLMNPE